MLDYSFDKFLKGEQDDKKANIMYAVVDLLLKDANENVSFGDKSGQTWFDSYLAHVQSYEAKEGLKWVEMNMPKAYILLNLTKSRYTF